MTGIHNIFILKDGVPVFHVNPISNLIQVGQPLEIANKVLDSALIAGFLSAIASFAGEIGVGSPKKYETDEIKFSFLVRSDFLFIIGTSGFEDKEIQDLIAEVAEKFLGMISQNNLNVKVSDLSPFNEILHEILTIYMQKSPVGQDLSLSEDFAHIIPHSHIIPEALEKLSETRRLLFKLINGANSVYEIAKNTNQDPRALLSLLRTYSKNGMITLQKA
jgi:hypothetical protein